MHETIGPYRIEAELGRGGAGVVYAAQHPDLGRRVAIKLLLEADPHARARFAREARALGRLRHPHIVTVHEQAEDPAGPYLVMDLIEGESLDERIRREGPLPVEEAARIAAAMCEALSAAHAAGILHRDLKPGNVLLRSDDGRALLTDFGLARSVTPSDHDRLTATGELLGTPAFMAPEQTGAGSVDERSDVYGVGATLYTALTGAAPFDGPALLNIINAVLSNPPAPPRSIRPEIPRDLEAICLRCLAKDPSERYADAEALSADLARFERGEPVAAAPTLAARLRRAGAVLWAAPLLLIAGGAGVWAIRSAPTPVVHVDPMPSSPATAPVDPDRGAEERKKAIRDEQRRAAQLLRAQDLIQSSRALRLEHRLARLDQAWKERFAALDRDSPARRLVGKEYARLLFTTLVGPGAGDKEVRAQMRRVIALDPDHVPARVRSARKPKNTPDGLRQARAHIDHAIRLDGPKPHYLAIKAELCLRESREQEKRDEALELALRAAAGSDSHFVWRVLGDVRLARREFREGVQAYTRALTAKQHHDALARRGWCHLALGELPQARRDLQAALKRYPDWPAVLGRLGIVELQSKAPRRALEHIERAVRLSDQDGSLRVLRARARFTLGDYRGALRDLEFHTDAKPLIWLDPRQTELLLRRVKAKLAEQR